MTGDSRYILREATPSELEHARRAHASSWAGGLTVEQYIGREIHIASQTLTKDGGIRFWILTTSSSPQKLLCSCESIAKPAIVRAANKHGKDEVVKEVKSHVIGSVFTPEQNRGKGYASIMLDLVGERLRGECEFDSLYSDIGKTFYARKGWKPYQSSHIDLPPAMGNHNSAADVTVKLLDAADLPELCEKDTKSIISSYENTRLPPNVDARIAYLPTYPVIRWHHAREEYVGKHLTGKSPTIKGALAPSGKRWCIWTRTFNSIDPKAQKLSILRLVDLEPSGSNDTGEKADEEIEALIRAAQEQAKIWGMKEVLIWSPGEKVIKAAKRILGREIEVVDREVDSIASLRWNSEGGNDMRVLWELNEKFAWC